MYRTLFSRNGIVGLGALLAAAWVSPAAAQVAVSDAGATAVLQSILAELKAQTTLMNTQNTTLAEIKETNEKILSAICGASTIATRIASVADTDSQNFGSLGLALVAGELPEGVPAPQMSNIDAIKKTVTKLYGMARQAQTTARQAERVINQARNFDPTKVNTDDAMIIGRKVLAEARRQRLDVHIDSVGNALAASSYSLADATTAKTREVSLEQARGAADCLREDIKALNQTNLELARRLNHLIMIQGNDLSLRATSDLQTLPLSEVQPEGENNAQ